MIRVIAQPEPVNFEELVRGPGKKFLQSTPNPKGSQWNAPHDYWKHVKKDLRTAYRAICAYTCRYVIADELSHCDHFKPKDDFPNEAYEWLNYRLACALPNIRKRKETILDPFEIQNGWFTIDFPSLLVRPAPDLDEKLKQRVNDTITTLRLNDETTCRNAREEAVREYCRYARDNSPPQALAFALRKFPFLAMEIQRNGLIETLRTAMRYTDADLDAPPA